MVGIIAGADATVDARNVAAMGMMGEGRGDGGRREIVSFGLNVAASVSAILANMGVSIDTGMSMKIVALTGNVKKGIVGKIMLENVIKGVLLPTHMVTVAIRDMLKTVGNRRAVKPAMAMPAKPTTSATSIGFARPLICLATKRGNAALATTSTRTPSATTTRTAVAFANILTAFVRTTARTGL